MVHCSRRRTLGTLLALVMLIALTALLVFIGSARASEATAASSPAATVVREEVAKRTQYAATYLMSDGTHRTIIYQAPIHFRDEKGDWQPVNRSLLPVDGIDAYRAAATPVEVTFADEAPGQKPVTVISEGWTVTMNLEGCAEDDKLILGDSAVYLGVAPDTDVTYTVLGDGLKEVITLASAKAPSEFSYRLSHPGLTLRRDDADQGWALFAPGKRKPVFYIGAMNVSDSSRDEIDEPAWCEGAKMTVAPGEDASTLTFSVPRAWLEDPARVYPVRIDPNIGSDATKDTYLSQGLPTQSFGTLGYLFCGRMASDAGKCRTLVRFPQVSTAIGAGRHITSSTFQLYEYWQPETHTDTVYVDKLSASSVLWQDASTYNSANSSLYSDYSLGSQNVVAGSWLSMGCQSAVQEWLDDGGNRGFLVYEPDAAGSGWSRKFRSVNYPSSSAWPKLIVESEVPTTSTSGVPSVARVGSTLSVTVSASGVSEPGEITSLQLGINRAAGQTSRTRGLMCWYPAGVSAPSGSWGTPIDASGGGCAAVSTDPDDHSSAVNLISASHSGEEVTFTFSIGNDWADPAKWGEVSNTTFDSRLDMSSGAHASWDSLWFTGAQQMSVLPAALASAPGAETTASAAWFVEEDTSSPLDGLPDNACNANGAGRGDVNLTWSASPTPGVAGYAIYLFDGEDYHKVGSAGAGATGWSSAGKAFFPTDAQIGQLPGSYSGNPFRSGDGVDLRDSPDGLYAKTAGTSYDGCGTYYFRVVPYFASNADPGVRTGDLPRSATLARRTVGCNDDRQHTTYGLGAWNEHDATAVLDEARLELEVTDLSIASWGPEVALTRHWSTNLGAGLWAPGWRFSFERSLSSLASSTVRVYVDEAGVEHRFCKPIGESEWQMPAGFSGILTEEGAGWQLTLSGDQVLHFDVSGRLTSETDRNGNAATYSYAGSELTSIEAANGQEITLTYAGGKLASASYATEHDGEREVSYSPSIAWRVTYFPGEGEERTVEYGYDADRLSSVAQLGWPGAGQSAAEQFTYDGGGKLTRVDFANYDAAEQPDAYLTIAYDEPARTATVTRRGCVNDVPGSATQAQQLTWLAGLDLVAHEELEAPAGQDDVEYDYDYNEEGYWLEGADCSEEAFDEGYEHDKYGNLLSESYGDEDSGDYDLETSYALAYPESDLTGQVVAAAGPEGSSLSSYDEAGNLSGEVEDQAPGRAGLTESEYDEHGRLTFERQLVSGAVTSDVVPAMTSPSAPSGAASCGGYYSTYDAWRAFDDAQVDGTSCWLSAGGVENWWLQYEFPVDHGKTVTQYAITTRNSPGYESAPRSWTLQGFNPGDPEWTILDSESNVTDWASAPNERKAFAVAQPKEYRYYRLVISESNREGCVGVGELELRDGSYSVSDPVWAETDYDEGGFSLSGEPLKVVHKGVQLSPGGDPVDLVTERTYDEFGNLTSESEQYASGEQDPATADETAYDLAGRALTSADAAGVVTHSFYDALGNVTSSYRTAAGTQVKADWTETEFDAAGNALVVTTKLSDASGVPTTQRVVQNAYDGTGHQLSSSDSTVAGQPEKWVYDAAGNVTRHWAMGASSYAEARSARSAFDAEGRSVGESAPGNSVSPGPESLGGDPDAVGGSLTTYDADAGWVHIEKSPDGSTVTHGYDEAGNEATLASTVAGTTTSTYDEAGRLAVQTDERGFTTSSTYDLLGRVTGAQGSGQEQTQTTYNTLGWVLQTVDASGVTVTRSYDAHGNLTSEARGSAGTTESTYDAADRLLTRTDPNGNLLTCAYDALGNLHEEKHEDWSSNLLKDVVTDHDSLGRPTSQTEAVSGRTSTWTYPLNTEAGVEESVSFEGEPASFTFGNEAAETGSDYGLVNIKVVGRFTLGEAASVAKLTGRISNDDSGHKACAMRALIYADSGGAPGALLASGVRVEVADGAAAAWIDLPFAQPVGLTAGDYWIGLIGDAAASALDLKFAATGGATAWAYDSYADGASDPFGSAGSAGCKLAIYASCEVGDAAVTTEVERSARGVETSRATAIGSASTQDAVSYLGYSAVSSASASYSGAVTVPEGADFALIGIAYWNQADGSAPPIAISLDGQAAAQVGSVTYEPYRETLAVYRVAGFASGSKTFACSWASVGDGVHYTILYCSGVDAERPVRDFEYVTNIGGAVTSPPFASSAGDLVCAFASSGNGAPTMTGGGQTLVESGGPLSGAWWGSARKAGSGDTATVTLSGCGAAQMMGLSLRPASTTQNATVTRTVTDDANGRDAADRWTSASLQLSGFNALTINRGFDDAGRVTSQSGAGFGSAGSYSYHPAKGLKARQDLPLALGGRIQDNYAYASDGRLESWSVGPSATPTPMATYSYDPAGNLTGDGATSFAYSASGQDSTPNRLVSSTSGGATTVYGWDQANAWRTSQGPTGDPDQVQYTYAKSGAATSNGRMTRYQNEAAETDATYAYDASGQRLTSDVTVDSVQTVTRFTYEGLTLLRLTATQGADSWRIDYLYDEEGVLYGGVYRSPAHSSVATPFTVITNDHGDVLGLLDAGGHAFASYRYDPWGVPLALGTTAQSTGLMNGDLAGDIAARQILRYASYAYDAESGLYYCSARYYDPATRQWASGDPAKDDGEGSAYQYCRGNPVGHTDPTGMRFVRFDPADRLGSQTTTSYCMYVLKTDAAFTYRRSYKFNHDADDLESIFEGLLWFYDWNRPNNQWDFRKAKYYETRRWHFRGKVINADDFGNIHYGYMGYYWRSLTLKNLKTVGWLARFQHFSNFDTLERVVKGVKKEMNDGKMIDWGWRLARQYGMRGKGKTYYGIFRHK